MLQEIRKLIKLESANFKLDPELSPLNDDTLIPCRTIMNFFFHFAQRSDKSEENEEKCENRREKEGRENGKVNHHTTEQPSKKRKEDLPESKSEVKKPSPEKKKRFVSLLITILYCSKIYQYY